LDEYVADDEPIDDDRGPYRADAEIAEDDAPPRRRRLLPAVLFGLTCLSTFFTGGAWSTQVGRYEYAFHFNWQEGAAYMLAVLAILLAHEMGHFVQAVRHGIPASLPYFIPMPFSPFGTMGAVIGMQGSRADRRQLFDIGITGPLAGLVVALPIAVYGIQTAVPYDGPAFRAVDPLLFRWLIQYLRPELPADTLFAWNPFYLAAWVGMLITGLNMMPLSQLDGGHIAYALFGRGAHLLARGIVLAAFVFMMAINQYSWMMMLVVVFAIGIDHPPTSNDRAELGWPRRIIGFASLAIPILCLAPVPIRDVAG